MLLAFDTATPAVTVALYDDGSVVAESTVVDALRHGELLAPGIERVLSTAQVQPGQLTRIAVGVGPGPFTGLRVGIVTARTLGAVLDIPVTGVCSLDVLSVAVDVAGPFLVATDARRKEVYWARYSAPGVRVSEPAVDRPAVLATTDPVAGRGAVLYAADFPHGVPPEHPSAADLARLVATRAVEPLPPEPLYLRRPDVAAPTQPKRVV